MIKNFNTFSVVRSMSFSINFTFFKKKKKKVTDEDIILCALLLCVYVLSSFSTEPRVQWISTQMLH
jgi:hypothetical protein